MHPAGCSRTPAGLPCQSPTDILAARKLRVYAGRLVTDRSKWNRKHDEHCPGLRKKLIEVSIPLEAINAASAREKSIRHGHPSTLHLWWARRPLAACRAVLFAQLVDDPSAWPERFRPRRRRRPSASGCTRSLSDWCNGRLERRDDLERRARWEIARSVAWGLARSRRRADDGPAILAYLQEKAPPVYDPFSGGGSIPLEAQRLGLRAYGSTSIRSRC